MHISLRGRRQMKTIIATMGLGWVHPGQWPVTSLEHLPPLQGNMEIQTCITLDKFQKPERTHATTGSTYRHPERLLQNYNKKVKKQTMVTETQSGTRMLNKTSFSWRNLNQLLLLTSLYRNIICKRALQNFKTHQWSLFHAVLFPPAIVCPR